MPEHTHPDRDPSNALTVRLGRWFEARASGWGVLAIPLLAVALLVAAAAHVLPV